MFSHSILARGACMALVTLAAIGCDAMDFGNNEGNACDPSVPGICGSGLACYVPPYCAVAVCCPPEDAANPVCYCPTPPDAGSDAPAATDAGSTGEASSRKDAPPAPDAARADSRSTD